MLDMPTSLVAQTVKRLPTMQETRVQSLGWEDLLEKEMATHSSILAWKIPRTEEPGRLQSMGSQRVRPDGATSRLYKKNILLDEQGQLCNCLGLGSKWNQGEKHFFKNRRK